MTRSQKNKSAGLTRRAGVVDIGIVRCTAGVAGGVDCRTALDARRRSPRIRRRLYTVCQAAIARTTPASIRNRHWQSGIRPCIAATRCEHARPGLRETRDAHDAQQKNCKSALHRINTVAVAPEPVPDTLATTVPRTSPNCLIKYIASKKTFPSNRPRFHSNSKAAQMNLVLLPLDLSALRKELNCSCSQFQ